jgi:sulfur carrier protein|tara:strand:+ start:1724 stop:1924 length:201 start_codon:yes stop_codon:yes gene_type:complete
MKIIVNGKKIELPQQSNIEDLMIFLGYQNQRVAIEINELIIPKSNHSSYLLKDKDKVEIINAVGGG